MSKNLFDGSDGSDTDLELGNNKEYAKSYNSFRKKELVKKFKDRGLNVSESDSSDDSSSSSDEDGTVDPNFDREFFKTLASLKSKDPTIYDKNKKFFESVNAETDEIGNNPIGGSIQREKKAKPVTLKDYERQIILENGGVFEDDSDEDPETERTISPTLAEEEKRLKAEFSQAMNKVVESEDEEFGGIFKKRQKTKEEQNNEEEDFTKWLAGKGEVIEEDVKAKLEPLKKYWSSEKLSQSERFLRDYILNKGYADTNLREVPTYEEIVNENTEFSEDEQELERQAEFEHKYNFRFEEPDAEFVKRYPRTIDNSVRRTDDKRKEKRQEIKQRKQEEKEQKMKELEIVKEMKRKEIEEKIRKLKLVTGNEELGFKDEELEEDFDPDAHDKRMHELFDEEYYKVDEGEEKPGCPSDLEELQVEDWDNYNPGADGNDNDEYAPHCEDDDFNMDCDYDPKAAKEELQQELIENTKGRKNRKGRRNRFKEIIKAEKPPFNPEDEQTYAEYIDEYYKFECEDIIDDIPCRFKYVETTPNDFGLSIEEILLAKNKELNQWASLKKAIQIRPDHIEKKEQRLFKMKAKNEELKRKIFKSLYGESSSDDEDAGAEDTVKPIASETQVGSSTANAAVTTDNKKAKRRKRRKTQQAETEAKKRKTPEGDVNVPRGQDSNITTNDTKKKDMKNTFTVSSPETKTGKRNVKQQSESFKATNPFNTKNGFTNAKQQLPPLRRFRKNNQDKTGNNSINISDDRLKAYGINPRKFHKTQKYGNKQN